MSRWGMTQGIEQYVFYPDANNYSYRESTNKYISIKDFLL
jgi:hypothetical protein